MSNMSKFRLRFSNNTKIITPDKKPGKTQYPIKEGEGGQRVPPPPPSTTPKADPKKP